MAPHYAQLAQFVAKDTRLKHRITIAEVDCIKYKQLCQQEAIRHFPVVRHYKAGRLSSKKGTNYKPITKEFNGSR